MVVHLSMLLFTEIYSIEIKRNCKLLHDKTMEDIPIL